MDLPEGMAACYLLVGYDEDEEFSVVACDEDGDPYDDTDISGWHSIQKIVLTGPISPLKRKPHVIDVSRFFRSVGDVIANGLGSLK